MKLAIPNPMPSVVCFGPFRLYLLERRLERGGEAVDMGSRAFEILIALVEQAGEVIGNRDLTARVWRNVVVEESSLRVNIASLRRALDDGRDGPRYIANVPGQGYCFVAPLTWGDPPAAAPASTPAAPAGDARAYPLPGRLARMVGRAEAVAAIGERLMEHRFITVVGPGGIGKTTTAVAVAHEMLPAFEGAVCFIDLAPLASAGLLAGTVAATLGLMATEAAPAVSLTALLREQRVLLIMDNCEHLIEAVADLCERLFHGAPQVSILATSREPLRVEGEYTYWLQALDSPPPSPSLTAAEALSFPAVQLFVDRAAANGNHFEFHDADAPTVAEICRRLDGIALAIELGAGKVAAYGVTGTAELLDSRFRLSWHGRRTALPRHQTLRSMLDWSYNLLRDCERMALRRLSVFAGQFSLAAAAEVAGGDAEQVIDAIGSLVAKSLASAKPGQPAMGYRLLDSVRVYAGDKLRDSGEAEAVARRYAEHTAALMERDNAAAAPFAVAAAGPQACALDRLGDLRAALAWCFEAGGDPAIGVRLAAAAGPLLLRLSLLAECTHWSQRALASLTPEMLGGRHEMQLQEALATSSMFARGNSDVVRGAIERGLALARDHGDLVHELRLLAGLKVFLTRIADFAGALLAAQRSIEVARRLGDPVATAMAEWMLGMAHHLAGDQARARQHCEAGTLLVGDARGVNTILFGYDHRISALAALARALWLQGQAEQALRVAWQAINEARKVNHPVSVCIALVYAAPIFTWSGAWDTADELIGQLIDYARQHDLAPYHAVGMGLKGELLVRRGRAREGVVFLHDCLDVLRVGRHQVLNTVFIAALASGLAACGRIEEARATIKEAVAADAMAFNRAEILRVHAELQAA